MKSILILLAGLLGVFVSLGFILPSVAKLNAMEALATTGLLLVGILFAVCGLGISAWGIKGLLRAQV